MWTSSCEEAFMQLKQLLVQAPILAYPDFEGVLCGDGCIWGLSCHKRKLMGCSNQW